MMKPVIRGVGTLSVVIVLLTAGCAGSVASTPTPTAGNTFVATPSAGGTPTPLPATATSEPYATATPVPARDSGIDGIVLAGPTCPVERVDSPGPDRAAATTIAVFAGTSETDVVAQMVTGQDGQFRQPLSPGTYT